jgi:hypothetical protein
MRGSSKDYWLLLGGILPALVVVAAAYLYVPMFISMYLQVSSHLPPQTALLFAGYRWLALLPLAVVAAWFAWPQPKQRGVASLVCGVVVSGVVLSFGWWAAYQPQLILAAIRAGSHGP